ncbi:MAG: hypothetical protein KDJ35_00150 [Alphaproteobacteria bacterium]|nr:hypothetical protein [Alphaproteobacteria bacterium]
MKDRAKSLINPILYSHARRYNTSTIVASMGRSGSTMLCRAACKGLLGFDDSILNHKLSNQYLKEAWVLTEETYNPGFIYKTHDYPPTQLPNFCKVLFTYGDPFDIAVSVYNQTKALGEGWYKEHLEHFKKPYQPLKKIFTHDVLGLEEQFDSWSAPQSFPILRINYQDIWAHKARIDAFLGYKIILPAQKTRISSMEDLSAEQKTALVATYSKLRDKIFKADTAKD